VAEAWQGIRISLLSDKRYLGPLRTIVREVTGLVGLDPEDTAEIELAVTEGCANVIRHCYRNLPDERIDVVLTVRDGEFEIRIDDYGKFVDPSKMRGRNLDDVKPGGLGVHLMKRVMDEVTYTKNGWGGTTLTMRRRVARPKSERKGTSGPS